jgi:hypothetical protein
LGDSITVGGQFGYNFKSNEIGAGIDFSNEVVGGVPGSSADVNAGSIVTWGASDMSNVMSGSSTVISDSAYFLLGASQSVVISNSVDPQSGVPPVTVYTGFGFGSPGASAGAGFSDVLLGGWIP